MQSEILSFLGYGPKSFHLKGYNAQAKINVFYHNFFKKNYLIVFLVRGRSAENIEERRKQAEEKH